MEEIQPEPKINTPSQNSTASQNTTSQVHDAQQPVTPQNLACKYCGQTVMSNFYFCPYCGKKLINPPITILTEIGIYLISIFLPPLGLWPAFKYLLQKDKKAKRVATIAIILTIISSIITIWISIISFNGLMKTVNAQLNSTPDLQNIGY